MSEYTVKEKSIDPKDMLYRALKAWRAVLVGAIIIALLSGLFRAYKGIRVLMDDILLANAQEKYEIQLQDYQATGEKLRARIEYLREQSANQQEYNEKSMLMKIDPMNKWVGTIQLYIDSKYQIDPSLTYQNVDKTNRLISAYNSYLNSGELYQEMISQEPSLEEIRFMREVYSVSSDPGTATITVSWVGVTETEIRQRMEFIIQKFADQYRIVMNVIGDHSYEILTESVFSTIDLSLDATQKNNLLLLAEYANKIGETNKDLTEWEEEPEPQPEFGVWYTVKQTIKMVILGGIIGIVVMLAWFVLKYILSDTIKTDNDVRSFGMHVIGRIHRNRESRKFLPGIDRLIDRIFSCTCEMTLDQSCALATQNLGAVLKERGLSSAAIVGQLSDYTEGTITQMLDSSSDGIRLYCAGNTLTNPNAVKSMESCKAVFLLAERYVTKNADIDRTLTLLNAWGKTILGAITVE